MLLSGFVRKGGAVVRVGRERSLRELVICLLMNWSGVVERCGDI